MSEAVWQYLMLKPGQAGWGPEALRFPGGSSCSAKVPVPRISAASTAGCAPAFDVRFRQAHDVPFAVDSTSGTAAIHLALGAPPIEPGDEKSVITAADQ